MCEIRRRPTLPGRLHPSTIGAERLNFRVRKGNGCGPLASTTETVELVLKELNSEHELKCVLISVPDVA